PNNFAKEWLENRYSKMIKSTVYEVLGRQVELSFTLQETDHPPVAKPVEPAVAPASRHNDSNDDQFQSMMNPKYTFDTFVIGLGNRFAHAASLAVAEAPAKSYNPLFLYGGVGLGKTHLMHAIG